MQAGPTQHQKKKSCKPSPVEPALVLPPLARVLVAPSLASLLVTSLPLFCLKITDPYEPQ